MDRQGCPSVEKADRGLGKPWLLDLAAVVRLLEKRVADTTAEKLSAAGDGVTSDDETKRRRAVAAAVAEIEAAETVRTVVRVSAVGDRMAADYNEIRSRMQGLPDAIAGRVEAKMAARVREIADEQVRNALASVKADREFKRPGSTE